MKVLFVNDSTSNPNWGDRAAAIALRTMIGTVGARISYSLTEGAIADSALGDNGESSHFGQLQQSPRRSAGIVRLLAPPAAVGLARRMHRQRQLIPRTWSEFPDLLGALLGPHNPWPTFTDALAETDAVLIHGDGAITADGVAARTMFFIAYAAAQGFGTPVLMVNHTADLNHPNLREIAHHVYPLMEEVRFRDPISAQRSRRWGVFTPDAAFLFEPLERSAWVPLAARPTYCEVWPDQAAFDPSQPYVCIGGSSILAQAADANRLLDGYRDLINGIAAAYSGTIVLTVSDAVDQPFFRVLAREMGLPVIGLRTPVQQAVDVLGNADVYLGGRWHPSIFALRGGTPIVPLAGKTAKMQALAQMVGVTGSLPNAYDLRSSVNPLIRQLQAALEGGDGLRQRLRSWAAGQAQEAWTNVARLHTPPSFSRR